MSLAALHRVGTALRPEAVNEELLAGIYQAEAVETQDITQSWTAYLGHLAETARSAIFELIGRLAESLLGGSGASTVLAYGVVAVALVLLVLGLGRWISARRRRRARHADAPSETEPERSAPVVATGAASWRAELARRMAAGDLRAALEAAWWWLAASLVGETADPAWTTRELVAASGRGDLAPSTRRLDAMLYGDPRVEVVDLERWVRETEAKLAS